MTAGKKGTLPINIKIREKIYGIVIGDNFFIWKRKRTIRS